MIINQNGKYKNIYGEELGKEILVENTSKTNFIINNKDNPLTPIRIEFKKSMIRNGILETDKKFLPIGLVDSLKYNTIAFKRHLRVVLEEDLNDREKVLYKTYLEITDEDTQQINKNLDDNELLSNQEITKLLKGKTDKLKKEMEETNEENKQKVFDLAVELGISNSEKREIIRKAMNIDEKTEIDWDKK